MGDTMELSKTSYTSIKYIMSLTLSLSHRKQIVSCKKFLLLYMQMEGFEIFSIFIQNPNVEFSPVGPGCTFFKHPHQRSNVIEKLLKVAAHGLFFQRIRDDGVRSTHFLCKLLDRMNDVTFGCHGSNVDKTFVCHKELATGMTSRQLASFLCGKEHVHEKIGFEMMVIKKQILIG